MAETRGVEWSCFRRWIAAARLRATDEQGASLVEYVMLLSFIVIVTVVALGVLGGPVSDGLAAGGDGFTP